jgi:ComF family protein
MAVTLRGAARDLRDPVLVPVPLHWSRRARRGYDQARLLTAETARITGLPSAGRILFRSRRTLPQSRLSGVKRAGNVSGSFRAGKAARLGGRDVILVDDLVTTGATVLACREALLAAAPASISVLCAGRSGEIKNKVGLADSHMFE